jgi:hypothetical protein
MGFVGSGGPSLTLSDACLKPVRAHGEGASEACFDGRGDEAPVLDSDSIVVEDGLMGEGVLYRAAPEKVRFAIDSPVEEAGFELSVPRDTTKASRPPHVAFSDCR